MIIEIGGHVIPTWNQACIKETPVSPFGDDKQYRVISYSTNFNHDASFYSLYELEPVAGDSETRSDMSFCDEPTYGVSPEEPEPGSVNWYRRYLWSSESERPSLTPPPRGDRDRDDWLNIAQVCVKHGRTGQEATEIANGLLADLKSRFDLI